MGVRSWLGLRRPRGYHHIYIYVDERRERLEELKEKARREQGLSPERRVNPEDVRGKFVGATTHLRRRKERGRRPLHWAVWLFLIGLLAWLWHALLNGQV